LSCGLQGVHGLPAASVLLLQFVVVLGIVGHESQGGQEYDAKNGDHGEHADDQIPCFLVDPGLVLELVVHEKIADEHAALQQGPEDARVAGDGRGFTAACQVGSLTRPGDRGTQSQHGAAHVQQHRGWEHERDHEGPVNRWTLVTKLY